MLGVGPIDEILAVEELGHDVSAALLEVAAALGGEGRVAQVLGHGVAGPQGGQVQPAEPGHGPEPVAVQRVVLRAVDRPPPSSC